MSENWKQSDDRLRVPMVRMRAADGSIFLANQSDMAVLYAAGAVRVASDVAGPTDTPISITTNSDASGTIFDPANPDD